MPDDLRTLATEAIRSRASDIIRDAEGDYTIVIQGSLRDAADAVLAAVLPAHRRQVLGEAADSLTPDIDWQRETYSGDAAVPTAVGRLVGMEDAQRAIRRLADDTPPTPPSAPVSAHDGPAVPEVPNAATEAQRPAEGDSENVCPTCGTTTLRFDPPLVFEASEQCGVIKPGNWTAGYVPYCEMPKSHDGKHVHLIERTEEWD